MTTQYYYQGEWTGHRTIEIPISLHGLWNSAAVFDGARSVRRMAPDLLSHCQRVVAAAPSMLLQSPLTAERIAELCIEGIHRFPADAELYLTPLLFSTEGGRIPVAETTQFMLSVKEDPVQTSGFAVCTNIGIIRPPADSMQTEFKSSWLYANAIPARKRAQLRGFQDAVMQDASGDVVEFSTANLWLVRDGTLVTPIQNGSFLPGITRRRVLALLEDAGIAVEQRRVTLDDVFAADELFSSGNANKIRPVIRLDDRLLEPGPVFRRVRDLYWAYAATQIIE